MAKKHKSENSANVVGGEGAAPSTARWGGEPRRRRHRRGQPPGRNANDDDSDPSLSSSSYSDYDDDSLVLEGAMARDFYHENDDDEDDEEDSMSPEEEISSEEGRLEGPTKKARKGPGDDLGVSGCDSGNGRGDGKANGKNERERMQLKNRRKEPDEQETVQVEFLFCDVAEHFFHGMRTLLRRNTVHAAHSSQLAELVVKNEMVGTVLSTDVDPYDAAGRSESSLKPKGAQSPRSQQEGANVFGLASIINISDNGCFPCVSSLRSLCLRHCPAEHKSEMETVLSAETRRPAGFFLQERVVNVPMEITEVLHRQLVLDMDHAVKSATDDEERKILDFGVLVRLAPCHKSGDNDSVVYKYFEDEVFASNAEFVYDFKVPGMCEEENELWCVVVVLTKTGHQAAMGELGKMIHGGW